MYLQKIKMLRDNGLMSTRQYFHLALKLEARRVYRMAGSYALFSAGMLLAMIVRFNVFTNGESSKKMMEHIFGQAEGWAYKAECFLMLMTGSPAKAGGTGNEEVTMKKCKEKECTVTNYKRFKIKAAEAGHKSKFNEIGLEKTEFTNSEEWQIQEGLTGANQSITYWAIVQNESGESGNVIAWGSCESVSIGGTGTPVKIGNEKLKVIVQ